MRNRLRNGSFNSLGNPMLYFIIVIKMNINNKTISITFIVILAVTVAVSAIGMLLMSRQPMVLQGQIEATEIRLSLIHISEPTRPY